MTENTKYFWTSEKIKLLIEKSKSYPELWRPKVKDFNKRIKNQNLLKNIASDFKTSDDEILRKLQCLRKRFIQEVRKVKKSNNVVQCSESQWEFFNEMKFMLSSRVAREVQENLQFQSRIKSGKDERDPDENDIEGKGKEMEENVSNDFILQKALLALQVEQKPYDEHQIFGDYVASELRGLKKDSSRKKHKRLIQQSILQVNQEDDTGESGTQHTSCSNSTGTSETSSSMSSIRSPTEDMA